MKNKFSVFAAFATSAVVFTLPVFVFAQSTAGTDGIGNFIAKIGVWVRMLLPIMLTLGVLAFFYGLAMFLFKIGGEGGTSKGKEIMLYGVIAVFIMASIGGIVGMLQRTTGTDRGGTLRPPCIGDECAGGGRRGALPIIPGATGPQ